MDFVYYFIFCIAEKSGDTTPFCLEGIIIIDSFSKGTWYNERSVGLPIVIEMLKKYEGKNILEIGDTLLNYCSSGFLAKFVHHIVDKCETTKGVIKEDVVYCKSDKKYDLIVSISTLEHVDWDENPRDDMKILYAIENLKTLVAPTGGTIIDILPLGYNSALDKLLKDGTIRFTEQYHAKYNTPFPFVNGLLVGIITLKPAI